VNPLHLITAGVLAITLTIAAVLDFRYREVPRSVWLGAFLVAIPLGLYQWLAAYHIDPPLAILNILIVALIVVGSWFAVEFQWGFNRGDFIGLTTVFVALSYGVYPLLTMFFTGLWCLVVIGVMLILHRNVKTNTIPFLVPLALGLLTSLLFWW
jgi:prepilin signal peptidase PulO-like enzyme (type II secretory pathway)